MIIDHIFSKINLNISSPHAPTIIPFLMRISPPTSISFSTKVPSLKNIRVGIAVTLNKFPNGLF